MPLPYGRVNQQEALVEQKANVVAFRPRQANAARPMSALELVSSLLSLAKQADESGYPTVAALLVGTAYGVADCPAPDGGRRSRG